MVTFSDVKNNKEINYLIESSQKQLDALGYTEHSMRHINIVSNRAAEVLQKLDYNEHRVELARIAGYMHDIGNAINRTHHAEYGALLANDLLKETDMSLEDRITVIAAIGNHDESTGSPEDVVSAALIIADKTEAYRAKMIELQSESKEFTAISLHERVSDKAIKRTVGKAFQSQIENLKQAGRGYPDSHRTVRT